jgi:predicted O-methyltransferase YrrM
MMNFWQEFLPTQEEYAKLGPDKWIYHEALFNFISAFNGFSDYSDLKLEVPEHMPIEKMASNPVTIALLQFLIRANQIEHVLEIGTYIGISAIKMRQAMGPYGGSVLTFEKGEEFAALSKKNIQENLPRGIGVTIYHEDALPCINKWAKSGPGTGRNYGLIFLDADKEHYDEYLEPLTKLLWSGGLLVVDDVLFHGDVLNAEPTTDKGRGCLRLLQKAKTMSSWTKILLPLSNGILILQKPV